MSLKLILLKKYPFLIPNFNFTLWKGFIKLKNEEYVVEINCPKYPSTKHLTIKFEEELESLVNKQLIAFNKLKRSNLNLKQFLDKFIKLIDHVIRQENQMPMLSSTYFSHVYNIYKDLDKIKDSIVEVSNDYKTILLEYVDGAGRSHELGLTNTDALRIVITSIDIPNESQVQLRQLNRTCYEIYSQFCEKIDLLQDFFDVCDLIDNQTTVLEPQDPKREHTFRKIGLSENVTVHISLNVAHPHSCPDIDLTGEGTAINSLKTTLESNLKERGWCDDSNVIENLLILLEIDEFPELHTHIGPTQAQLGQGECSICLSKRHGVTNDTPVNLCSNERCASYYHEACLSKWLESIPTSETAFGMITGKCPLCKMNISCRLIDDNDSD